MLRCESAGQAPAIDHRWRGWRTIVALFDIVDSPVWKRSVSLGTGRAAGTSFLRGGVARSISRVAAGEFRSAPPGGRLRSAAAIAPSDRGARSSWAGQGVDLEVRFSARSADVGRFSRTCAPTPSSGPGSEFCSSASLPLALPHSRPSCPCRPSLRGAGTARVRAGFPSAFVGQAFSSPGCASGRG